MKAPTSLVDIQRLTRLCDELLQLSIEITPELNPEDRLDRVAAAASCMTNAPDAWLQAALEQLQQEAA